MINTNYKHSELISKINDYAIFQTLSAKLTINYCEK